MAPDTVVRCRGGLCSAYLLTYSRTVSPSRRTPSVGGRSQQTADAAAARCGHEDTNRSAATFDATNYLRRRPRVPPDSGGRERATFALPPPPGHSTPVLDPNQTQLPQLFGTLFQTQSVYHYFFDSGTQFPGNEKLHHAIQKSTKIKPITVIIIIIYLFIYLFLTPEGST